jgi:hypothetical protein
VSHDKLFIFGKFPAMILASALFSSIQVGPRIEACFQNFAAGLIIAAGKLPKIVTSSTPIILSI